MRKAVTAIAWEFWGANRRAWCLIAASCIACALLFRVFAERIRNSDDCRFFCLLPMVMSLIVAAALCHFTDRRRREGIAGFPRHLFSLPISTHLAVSCAFACGVATITVVYTTWTRIVFSATVIDLPFGWPLTVMIAGMVFYQAIVWCLCGFRILRIVALSLVAVLLVTAGILPSLPVEMRSWATEGRLTAVLAILASAAYAVTLVTVDAQRRGGFRSGIGIAELIDACSTLIPARRQVKSAEAALFWTEWRRTGLVLPAAALIAACLILCSFTWFTKRDTEATLYVENWFVMMPILLAIPIGLGFGKPDFWSLDLSLPSFVALRPVTAGQLIAVKLKVAFWSTFVAWAIVICVSWPSLAHYGDTRHWHELARLLGFMYSPVTQWAVPVLAIVVAATLTWSLLVSSIWVGYAGRPWFYYTFVALGTAAFLALLACCIWWQEHPHQHGNGIIDILPVLPWILATFVSLKAWSAAAISRRVLRQRLLSKRAFNRLAFFAAIAALFVCLFAFTLSPKIEWLRDTLLLAGLFVLPASRIALAPLALTWNRHR